MLRMTRKEFIGYAVLPGFRQRFHDLFATGFQYVPYFMALVYGAVRLLPANHPYLDPSNMGRYGVRHVIAEAANNIVFSRRNIDQILLFFTILFGMILVILQIGILGLALFMQPAVAAMPTDFAGFFLTPDPTQDLAHIMLDLVFGVGDGATNLFNSCVAQLVPCTNIEGVAIQKAAGAPGTDWAYQPGSFPMPVHRGLHQLFQLYNIGLTVVAVFISIYFIMTVIAETAQSGTPFGKRFNKVWAPVRFVVAFGLLFPVAYGYNTSQYIVFYAAKFGSGFATNGWNIFNDTLSASYGSAIENLLSDHNASATNLMVAPNTPEVGTLLQFMYSAKVCAEAYHAAQPELDGAYVQVRPYVVGDTFKTPAFLLIDTGTTYDELMNFTAGDTQAIIRFGRQNEAVNANMLGFVDFSCGELVFKLHDPRLPGAAEQGVEAMQRYYFFLIQELWYTTLEGQGPAPYVPITENYTLNTVKKYTKYGQAPGGSGPTGHGHNEQVNLPEATWRTQLQDFYSNDLRNAMTNPGASGLTGIIGTGAGGALEAMQLSNRWDMNTNMRQKGWAGAGVWYNRIAEMNGGMISAVLGIPLPSRYPLVMEKIHAEKRQNQQEVNFLTRFEPVANTDSATEGQDKVEKEMAVALWQAFKFWQDGGVTSSHNAPVGNAVVDILNALFGTEGLFDMRRNSNAHPLAQLTGVGRSLIEGSIQNLTYATIGGAGGALAATFDRFTGATAASFSGFLITFAMIGLTAGFILFYIVPFLPFIYFFFAVGGWVKGIFEAMVGAPLWALAHLRIDGNGLPGQAAVAGYFLVFEVFLRPILIVFGLLASISIFGALVSVLHQIFDLVVANTGGFDVTAELTGIGASQIAQMRGAIDEFFFTIIYTILVYLMGMSSFKLVDLIPNNILRWMGQSVATFGDQREDTGQSLVGSSTVGAQQALGSIGGGLQQIAGLGARGGK